MRFDCDVRMHDRFNEFIETTAGKKKSVLIGITDQDIAPYATYLEFGWVQRVTKAQHRFLGRIVGFDNAPRVGGSLVLQPRPFMRSTMEAKAGEWMAKFSGYLKTYGIENLEDALAFIGQEATQDIQTTIENNGPDGGEDFPERKPLTMAIYSALYKNKRTDAESGVTRRKALVKTGSMRTAVHFLIE